MPDNRTQPPIVQRRQRAVVNVANQSTTQPLDSPRPRPSHPSKSANGGSRLRAVHRLPLSALTIDDPEAAAGDGRERLRVVAGHCVGSSSS
jgi:hypothetical protein